jgi:hypothetical protein
MKDREVFACLVLKTCLRLVYRGTEALLRDGSSLGERIGLKKVPDEAGVHSMLARQLTERLVPSDCGQGHTP